MLFFCYVFICFHNFFSVSLCLFFWDDTSQPAWDVFEISQKDLHWERHLKDPSETSQKRHLLWDLFKTFQIHLRKYVSSQIYLKKDVFQVTSLKRLKHISEKMFILWRLWYVSKIYLESICNYSKMSHKNRFVKRLNRCVDVKNTQKMKRCFLGELHSH